MKGKKKKGLFLVLLGMLLHTFLLPNPSFCEMRTIKGDRVNLRSGPGTAYSVKWEFGSGFPVEIIKIKGSWVNVRDFENETGWVHRDFLTQQPQVIVTANPNSDGKINIRSEPGLQGEIIGKAYYGVVFTLLEKRTGWVKIRHETGLAGWIQEDLLWGY
jgi:SH3-like domain-containing protein